MDEARWDDPDGDAAWSGGGERGLPVGPNRDENPGRDLAASEAGWGGG